MHKAIQCGIRMGMPILSGDLVLMHKTEEIHGHMPHLGALVGHLKVIHNLQGGIHTASHVIMLHRMTELASKTCMALTNKAGAEETQFRVGRIVA